MCRGVMPVRYIGGQNWGEDQLFQDETGVDELGINLRILTTSNFSLLLAMHHEARPARHHSSRECEVTTVQGGGPAYCHFVYSIFASICSNKSYPAQFNVQFNVL